MKEMKAKPPTQDEPWSPQCQEQCLCTNTHNPQSHFAWGTFIKSACTSHGQWLLTSQLVCSQGWMSVVTYAGLLPVYPTIPKYLLNAENIAMYYSE